MRRLFAGGLCLALGLVATHARADDPWRPARRGTEPQAPARAPGLLRPIPLESGTAARDPITPVSFTPVAGTEPRPLTRAKPFDPPQPMPAGPPVPVGTLSGNGKGKGDSGPKPEPIAPPRAAPAPAPDAWGSPVSRWLDGQPCPGEGTDVPLGSDGGVACGDACGPCDGPCRPRLGLLRRRLFGDGCGLLCGDPCGGCCEDPCARRRCVYGRAEYILWWVNGTEVPALVTTSPAGTARPNAGVLGAPGTAIVFGNNEIDYDAFSGGRFTLGFCLPNHPGCSFESTFFFLGGRSNNFAAGSNGSPILARPINNVRTGEEEAQLVAFPDVVVGGVIVHSETRLWGIEGNFRKQLCCGCNGQVDLLVGFRYLELSEELDIAEDLTTLAAEGGGVGTRIQVRDSFHTRNNFYGGQLGLEGERRLGRWVLGGTAKVGIGVMQQQLNINGATRFAVPGAAPTVERGGLLALPTNIGQYRTSQFAVVPEVGVRLGYQLTECLRLYAGYNFLYASNVVRPGENIDRVVNKTQIPTAFGPSPLVGAARPMVLFRSSDFWAHGVSVGLELKY